MNSASGEASIILPCFVSVHRIGTVHPDHRCYCLQGSEVRDPAIEQNDESVESDGGVSRLASCCLSASARYCAP